MLGVQGPIDPISMGRQEPPSLEGQELPDIAVEALPLVPYEAVGPERVAFEGDIALDPHGVEAEETETTIRGEDESPSVRDVLRNPAASPAPPRVRRSGRSWPRRAARSPGRLGSSAAGATRPGGCR